MGGNFDKGNIARPSAQLPLNPTELEALFDGNAIARRCVTLVPGRATRRGWTAPEMGQEDDRLGVWDAFQWGSIWANVYGGAIAVMVTEDNIQRGANANDWLRQPLNPARVGKVLSLPVFDAVECWPHRWDEDVRSPRYRMPLEWAVSAPGFRAVVHASRVIHFRGARRSPNKVRGGWQASSMPDSSVFQAIWDEVKRLTQLNQAGATIAQELREGVLTVGNLESQAVGDEADSLWERFRNMSLLRGLLGMTVIGAGDKYETRAVGATGYAELSTAGWTALSAATGIPQTILQGESPGGLGTDGESAHQGFRQLVSDFQEASLRGPLKQLYSVVYAAEDGPTGGVVPDEWAISFAALDEPSETEVAAIRKTVAETDAIYVQMGAYTPEDVALSRFSEDGWSMDMGEVEPPDPLEEDAIAAAVAEALAAAQPVAIPADNAPRTDADHSGVCILVPASDHGLRRQVEQAIGQTLTAEDDPHVTVIYLGEVAPEDLPEVEAAVREAAAASPVSTLSRPAIHPFPPGASGTPIVLEFEDGWELATLHDRLLVRLAHLVSVRQHPKYRIHQTLGYAPQPLSPEALTRLVEITTEARVPVVELRVMAAGKQVASVLVGA